MDITAKLTLVFSGAGAIAGFISGFLPNPWLALLVALILLYASYKLTTFYLKKSTAQPAPPALAPGQPPAQTPVQPQLGKKKITLRGFMIFFATLVTKGEPEGRENEVKFWFWPYYIMWLILWIMVYTLMLL